jgi:hypothetical protein
MRCKTLGLTLATAGALICVPVSAQDQAEQLRTTERERLRALVDADVERARQLHADDFQLVNPAGGTLSKAAYLGQIASGELDYLVWEPGAIEVRWYGEAAVLRYQAQAQATFAGQKTPLRRFWHTDVYERRSGRWQVVWSHATQIQ